jgi:hypothetical protein
MGETALGASLVRFQEKVVLMVPRARSSSPRMLCRRAQTARLDVELVALRARRWWKRLAG